MNQNYTDILNMKRYFFLIYILSSLFALHAYEEEGGASWYGPGFQGNKTANGEIFDTNKLTAAHKTLPFNTMVRVTNLENGKSVIVKINDRGPFVEGRIIDLSRKGAEELGMLNSGIAQVRLETVDPTVEATDNSGPLTVTIQVAAFSDLNNALQMKKKLIEAGYEPTARLSDKGITRLFLDNIPVEDSYTIVQNLKSLKIENVVIRQNRE
jgi:rare lipoprotein A